MPNPVPGDVHVNRPMTMVSVAMMQRSENFVASRVFPNIAVQKQSDLYFEYPRGSFNRDEMKPRAPSTESAGGGYEVDTASYDARVWAFHKDIDDQLRANSDAPINLDREATEYCTTKALIRREKQWVTNYFTAGDPGTTWTFDLDGVTNGTGRSSSLDPTDSGNNQVVHWSDGTNGTPVEDVALGKRYVLEATGFEPNVMVVGYEVWEQLKNHPDIVDRIKYSGGVGPNSPAVVTVQAVAALFEVERLLVMKATENTADEGQTASHSFIGGKNALLCYAAPAPGIMTPSAGYTFSWNGYLQAGPEGNRIKRYRVEQLNSDRIEIEIAFDMKKVAADLGFFYGGIVA